MPSLGTPRGVLTFKILHHSRGGCATLSLQESFWLAQPSGQGWLGLLHISKKQTLTAVKANGQIDSYSLPGFSLPLSSLSLSLSLSLSSPPSGLGFSTLTLVLSFRP